MEFVEAKGGREIANHALGRAQKFFFKVLVCGELCLPTYMFSIA